MKIRLYGTEEECRETAGRLAAIIDVLSVLAPYPDRGASRLVRVYFEARFDAPPVHVTCTTVPARHRHRTLPPGGGK
jgi:hypothetical protein